MGRVEAAEMQAHRRQLDADVRRLVEKYRAIFGWDVPEIDQAAADRLILDALRRALDEIEQTPGA
jgi:hypothetical protein